MAQRNNILVSRTLYQIGVITLVTAVIWAMIGVYNAMIQPSTSLEIDKAVSEPLVVNLDIETIKTLAGRTKVEGVVSTSSPSASQDANMNVGAR